MAVSMILRSLLPHPLTPITLARPLVHINMPSQSHHGISGGHLWDIKMASSVLILGIGVLAIQLQGVLIGILL